MKGMIIGIIVSVAIVVLFGALFFVSSRGVPDTPTSATGAEVLEEQTLPESLPEMFEPTDVTAEANDLYERVVNYYERHRRSLDRQEPPTRMVEELVDLLIEAGDAGQVRGGLLDGYIPMSPGASPQFGAALESAPVAAADYAHERGEVGQISRALDANRAVWAFGERLFRHSERLYNRRQGLQLLMLATNNFYQWADSTPGLEAKLDPWVKAIGDVSQAWDKKVQIIRSVRPHIGDLLNIALNDQDPTFRIEATLALGVAKFNPRSKGNQRAIEEAIATLEESPHPKIALAAQTAEAFTKSDLQGLH